MVGLRSDDAEDLEGQMVAAEKLLRHGRCTQAGRNRNDATLCIGAKLVATQTICTPKIIVFFPHPQRSDSGTSAMDT